MDFATSSDPAVQAQLDRLAALSLPQGRFALDTIRALLERLGSPETRLPPVFHVAGPTARAPLARSCAPRSRRPGTASTFTLARTSSASTSASASPAR
jgi:hypothetical protein